MSSHRSTEYLVSLVHQLCGLSDETEWLEFKHNNNDPKEIGEYISALANSAALAERAAGFVLWGIESGTHAIVGTMFSPRTQRVGNEELEGWLARLLDPKPHFIFHELVMPADLKVVVLEIPRAFRQPVRFQGAEYIRIGSYKKKLRDFPEKERALWRIFEVTSFEDQLAAENVHDDEVIRLIDYPSYFDLAKLPLPEGRDGILSALREEGLVGRSAAGRWDITNLGALLFAKRLADFGKLARKAVRVIVYRNNSRIETVKEQLGTRGYASGFEGLIGYINGLLPSNEVVGQALRETVPMYPELAVRELVANALIHQDLGITGAGPLVEIFDGRMEISNPGVPLVPPVRFLDTPPRSRNERIAALMRRLGVCEERGSGIDKVIFEIEYFQLPAPVFEAREGGISVILFAHRPLTQMDKSDRIRACYQHACLRYVNREFMTNSSLRARFGIDQRNSATASRLIKEAVEAGTILPYDETAAPKQMKYVPFWAGESDS